MLMAKISQSRSNCSKGRLLWLATNPHQQADTGGPDAGLSVKRSLMMANRQEERIVTTYWAYSDDVQVGDNVFVRWGRFGKVTVRVVKVYPDGGLSCVRWNKRRERWTTPKRYNRTADGRNWIEHDQADRTTPTPTPV